MSPNTRLGPLSNFDLQGSGRLKVLRMDTKAARGHLSDGTEAILVQRAMQTSLTGIVQNTALTGRPGQ